MYVVYACASLGSLCILFSLIIYLGSSLWAICWLHICGVGL